MDQVSFNIFIDMARSGKVTEVVEILKQHPEWLDMPESYGYTPLFWAARNGHVDVVETLVNKLGSRALDTPNNNGMTPLASTVHCRNIEMVETLIGLGSRALDMPDKDGTTPLAWAAMRGYMEMVETLMRLGSQALDTSDKDGYGPLDWAVMNGKDETAMTLRALGAGTTSEEPSPESNFVQQVRFRVYFSESLVQKLCRFLA